ncbi:hypothetical protein AAHC03_013937 [Spirometra sp. Aus1]
MDRLGFLLLILRLLYPKYSFGAGKYYYNLCLEGTEQCTRIKYQKTDESKGATCRYECAGGPVQNGTEIWATYREHDGATPVKYKVAGLPGHPESFARHVQCVQVCELVADSLAKKGNTINMCICRDRECGSFHKWNNSFDSFKDCWSKCRGWGDPEKSVIEQSYVCSTRGDCHEFYTYQKSEDVNYFFDLVECINLCEASKGLQYRCDHTRRTCVPCWPVERDCSSRYSCSRRC